MRRIWFRFLGASMLLLACGALATAADGYREVGPKEASGIIGESRGKAGFVLLDVRTPGEFHDERIEGALNIDFNSADFKNRMQKLDRSVSYLVYCRTGNRSGQALKTMKALGFGNVIHLSSGIVKWKEAGYPTVKGR